MKANINQLIDSYISDNKQFIEGNIAEHLLFNFYASDQVIFSYLEDEEVEQMHNDAEVWKQFGEEIAAWIKGNYNYDISEF